MENRPKDRMYATTPFGDIAYTERGAGPAALFVHGVFLNGDLWRPVIDRVADVRRCIAVDLMAHGGTRARPDQDLSFDAQAAMLVALCDRLGLDRVDVVSNDSGTAIAQLFAARNPSRVRSLTLTNGDVHDNFPPPAAEPMMVAAREGLLPEIGRRMLADVEDARAQFAIGYEHPERLSADTLRGYVEPLFASPERTKDLERFILAIDCHSNVAAEPQLRRLTAPTLVVWGTGDIFFGIEWAHWLRDTIAGADRVIELPDAKLFFPEERPEELAEALREHWHRAEGARTAASA